MAALPHHTMLLSSTDLSLAYDYLRLLDKVSVAVRSGEKVGLVGRNGCGKSSLLKILAGDALPDSGECSARKGLRIGYLPQSFELKEELTVRDNILDGASDIQSWIREYESGEGSEDRQVALMEKINLADGWKLNSRVDAVGSFLTVPDMNSLVRPLSGGEKRRVALARSLVAQPDLLLLDEPTNHLDTEAIQWLESYIAQFPGAVIFTTHDRYFLDHLATRVVELDEGKAYSHEGNYASYLENKAIRDTIADQGERRRQRFLRVELDWVRAGVRARRTKSRHRLDTFYQTKDQSAPVEEQEMDIILPPPPPVGNLGVELKEAGLQVGNGAETRWLFRHLNLSLTPGKCIGIVGANGVGKTSLLRLCMGELEPTEGQVRIGQKIVLNYIDQSRLHLSGHGTVLEEIADGDETVRFGERTLNARAYLKRFQFPDHRANEPVEQLSGGERARLLLAKVLKKGGNFLILDEPTNDLDLPSLRLLEESLVRFEGSVMVVSHDRFFLDRVCDEIVAFEEEGVFSQPGNYSYYLEKRSERRANLARLKPEASQPSEGSPAQKPKRQRPRKLGYMEKRELDGMESTILEAEEKVAQLEKTLNDPNFYLERAHEAEEVSRELEQAKEHVATLYQRWETLASIEGEGSLPVE